MKKSKILKKIERHALLKRYTRLTREIGGNLEISSGFILDVSTDFILLQESEEFRIMGFQIIPIYTITHVRYNKNDKAYEHILKAEGLYDLVQMKYKVDLTSWTSICRDIQKTELTIISECERPDMDYFCIGELKRVNKKSISIRNFNAQGILDNENTEHKFSDITKLSFDDHYANVFSKYTIEVNE